MKKTYIKPAVNIMHLADRQPLMAGSSGLGNAHSNNGTGPKEGKRNPLSDEEDADPWQTEYSLWK